MCGIAGGVGVDEKRVRAGVLAMRHRGPDASGYAEAGGVQLGHARLSILDLDPRSNQPFERGPLLLSYNGELWNYLELREELRSLGDRFRTKGDTEVVAAALARWGVDALPRMNGMFALAWTTGGGTLHLARDRFGEIPLHVSLERQFLYASELKALIAMSGDRRAFDVVGPGERAEVTASSYSKVRWYEPSIEPIDVELEEASASVRELLRRGAHERSISDVPVCALLSGGLDSSAIVAFLREKRPGITAYTAVMDVKSPDLRAARMVSEVLGVELREVRLKQPTSDDLAGVVQTIEMSSKAQVEIGWACVQLADAMRGDGFKVTFSGEGSDELWGSYSMDFFRQRDLGWHASRRKQFLRQAENNFARCNKVFMSRSIECRLPFLHPPLVEYALRLPKGVVQKSSKQNERKIVLGEGVRGLLPDAIVDRAQMAFQIGTGMREKAEEAVADPKRYYASVYRRSFE